MSYLNSACVNVAINPPDDLVLCVFFVICNHRLKALLVQLTRSVSNDRPRAGTRRSQI